MARNHIAAALAAIFFVTPAWALNESFLKDAPLSRLSEDELSIEIAGVAVEDFQAEQTPGLKGAPAQTAAPARPFPPG